MEKLKSTYSQDINSGVLYELTSNILVLIDTYVKDNKFIITGTALEKYLDYCDVIKNISTLNGRKKLFYKIKQFYFKPSIKKANLLLHYLNKQVLGCNLPSTKISVSKLEAEIQLKKASWNEAKNLEKLTHKEYKDIKGDYFKTNRRIASWL